MKIHTHPNNRLLRVCLIFALLVGNALGRDPAAGDGAIKVDRFLKKGTWWELSFEKENNPLKQGRLTARAIQVVGHDDSRPSWIEIRYPSDMNELLKAYADKAAKDTGTPVKISTAEIEEIVTEWSRQWINLRFVVSAKPYGP